MKIANRRADRVEVQNGSVGSGSDCRSARRAGRLGMQVGSACRSGGGDLGSRAVLQISSECRQVSGAERIARHAGRSVTWVGVLCGLRAYLVGMRSCEQIGDWRGLCADASVAQGCAQMVGPGTCKQLGVGLACGSARRGTCETVSRPLRNGTQMNTEAALGEAAAGTRSGRCSRRRRRAPREAML